MVKSKFDSIILKNATTKSIDEATVSFQDWARLEKQSTELINTIKNRKPTVNFRVRPQMYKPIARINVNVTNERDIKNFKDEYYVNDESVKNFNKRNFYNMFKFK